MILALVLVFPLALMVMMLGMHAIETALWRISPPARLSAAEHVPATTAAAAAAAARSGPGAVSGDAPLAARSSVALSLVPTAADPTPAAVILSAVTSAAVTQTAVAESAVAQTTVAMLEYKAVRHGRRFARIGRFEPTSQVCSVCGVKDGPKPPTTRTPPISSSACTPPDIYSGTAVAVR